MLFPPTRCTGMLFLALAGTVLPGCGSEPASDAEPSAAGTTSAAALPPGARSPKPGLAATPRGFVDPSCVFVLQPGETVEGDGSISAAGARREVPACAFETLDQHGKVVPPRKVEPYGASTNWVESAWATNVPVTYLSATWKVPAAPSESSGQTLFFFPGLEPASTGGNPILQPVLTWVGGQWSIASWAVGPTNSYVSTSVNVAAGDTITGTIAGSGCNTTTGVCTGWTITTTDATTGKSTSLNAGGYPVAFDWAFGGVLEGYFVDDCAALAGGGQITFGNLQFKNAAGTSFVEPWATWVTSETPTCNFSVSTTSSSATLDWGTVGSATTASTLGFEQSSQWSTSGGATLGSSTYATQGQASLTVTNASNTVITSSPMSTPEAVGSQLAVDIALPPYQPNPNYYGWLQASINIPSRRIYNQYLGQASLTGLPLGSFNTVVLPVPSSVVTALGNTGYTDLTISLTLNVPANPDAFEIDNLRFFPKPCTVPTSGMSITANTRLCNGIYPVSTATSPSAITIGASGVTLTCDGTDLLSLSGMSGMANPNSAIGITGHNNVTVTGCNASGFRYGAMVKQASGVTFNNVNFSNNYDGQSDGTLIQGGGINLTNVQSSTIENSRFSNNWNGIELVSSSAITVAGNTASDCFNTGATLFTTTNSQILSNSFVDDVRGVSTPFDPSDPGAWYGAGTGDSAAILLEAGSNGNLIAYNDATQGGDGIFIRAELGPCSVHNQVVANDGSYSPNNAFECWCPDNVFDSNTANSSNFGIWVGGSDRARITNNTVNNDIVDGISLQNGWGRHVLIDNNTIDNAGRYGLFISAWNCQSGSCLTPGTGPSSNESQYLVQRNTISSSVSGYFGDMYLGNVLGVQRASNCSTITDEVGDTTEFSPIGSCNGANGRVPPTAVVASLSPVTAGSTVTLDGSKSAPGVPGATLTYNWLVNPAGPTVLASPAPSPLFDQVGSAKQSLTFPHPGMFDVDLTVTDFYVGGQTYTQLAVFPTGHTVGATASTWTCTGCSGSPSDDTTAGLGGDAVKLVTDINGIATVVTPATGALAYNAGAASHLGFFVKTVDQDDSGISSSASTPVITLTTNGSGTLVYTPAVSFADNVDWTYVEVPLAPPASSGWSLANNGGSLTKVDSVQIVLNGQGWAQTLFAPVTYWVQAVTFY